jgi:hypothetical protein
VAGAAGLGGAAYASHQFSDVSNGHPFHEEIAAIADAGITTGFEDGTYRPSQPVSRGAMAAFMSRGFSRVVTATSSETMTSNVVVPIVSVEIEPPGTPEGSGYVVVTGTGQVSAGTGCPCTVRYTISTDTSLGADFVHTTVGAPGEIAVGYEGLAVQEVFSVDGGAFTTFNLNVQVLDSDATALQGQGTITAVYVPFAGSSVA